MRQASSCMLFLFLLPLAGLPGFTRDPGSISISPANPTITTVRMQQFSALSNDGTTFAFGQANAIAAGVD